MLKTQKIFRNASSAINEAYLKELNSESNKFYRLYDDYIIGRDMTNDIILHDNFISRKHARINHISGQFFITDLDSQNGVFVNGARIKEVQLKEGDFIKIGNFEYTFSCRRPLEKKELSSLHSNNLKWKSVLDRIPQIAKSDQSILLQGESGVGKEVLSRSIHENSNRFDKAFISINCGNLNKNLVESDLFGHKKGSFTDAGMDRKGAFVAAHGGTLLLDEIGDMPLDLQTKLLRALENREVQPLGSDEIIKTDVRIIAATHKNLQQLVAEGKFRMDLYYRLNVINIKIPSLRERKEDFDSLLLNFAKEQRMYFPQDTVNELRNYDWPGNIRELKNFVLRAKALYPNEDIEKRYLSQLIDLQPKTKNGEASIQLPPVKKMEKELIETALKQMAGNQRRAAKSLGMPKSTLHDKVKRYGIDIHSLILGF